MSLIETCRTSLKSKLAVGRPSLGVDIRRYGFSFSGQECGRMNRISPFVIGDLAVTVIFATR